MERRTTVIAEDVEWMLDGGEVAVNIPRRLGITPSGVDRALRRAGRGDLIARMNSTAVRLAAKEDRRLFNQLRGARSV